MEAFLQLVWQQRLWTSLRPVGVLEGCEIEILDVGLCNSDAGPDFLEAKVRIDDITWVGAVEIHRKASQWMYHKHHLDAIYSGVILHVVEQYDTPIYGHNGRMLPTLVMSVPCELSERASYLTKYAVQLACSPLSAPRLSPHLIDTHLEHLSQERLRAKARYIHSLALRWDWHEALYIILMRYLGADLNNATMERLALDLPYKLVARYADNPSQFEALLLGRAGLIEQLPSGSYREQLEREYYFLQQKHQFKTIRYPWKQARTRPQAFPLRRLLQCLAILRNPGFGPTRLLACRDVQALRDFFAPSSLADYWQQLFVDRHPKALTLGCTRETLDALILNVALPFALAYKIGSVDEEASEKLQLSLMRQLSPEQNRVTRLFARAGIKPRHAADTQALVQCYKEYCKRRKCIYCPWGRHLLSMCRADEGQV